MPHLQVLVASTRPGRIGRTIADWVAERANAHGGFEVELVDLAEVGLPLFDEPHHPATGTYTKQHTIDWAATVDRADAFVFVTPEYNFGINAALKNAIDFLFHEWAYKPVGFVSYGGLSGGLRAVQMTKQVVTTLKMVPVKEAVTLPFAAKRLEDGVFRSDDLIDADAALMLDEVARLAAAFATLRAAAV
jgi:NAD(P)H-dependent FMN reductase